MPDDPIQTIRIETNKTRMGYYFESAIERQKAFTAIVVLGLQSMLIVNGGALAGMLTFIGNVPTVAHNPGVLCASVAFSIGIAAALFATLFAYATTTKYYNQSVAMAESLFWGMNAEPQRQGESDRESTAFGASGGRYEVVAVGLGIISMLAFVSGALTGILALTR